MLLHYFLNTGRSFFYLARGMNDKGESEKEECEPI